MKTIKFFIFLLLATLATQSKAANNYLPDTLWYDNGNEIYIRFSLNSIDEIEKLTNDSLIISPIILDALNDEDINSSQYLSITIDETTNDGILLIDKETESLIILPEQLNNKNTNFQSIKLKKSNGSVIDFYFTDLTECLNFIQNDWQPKTLELAEKLKESELMNNRHMITLSTRSETSGLSDPIVFTSGLGNLDQLSLTAGVGLNTFKKDLLPKFNFRMAFQFSRKGILKNSYFAEYELMYDFLEKEDGKTVPKSGKFLSLGYMHNFSDNPDEADWYGLSIGYLLDKKSPIFDDDTWKVSIYRKIGENKEVSAHLYFPDNFGSVFPGISLGIDL